VGTVSADHARVAEEGAFVWTDDIIARARKLWEEGLPGMRIALLIGAPSRSAVLGKAWREKWPRTPDIRRYNQMQGQQNATAAKRVLAESRPKSKLRKPKMAKPEPKILNPITLMQLGAHTCRWPVTDGDPWLFCGARCEGVYCGQHTARATVPAKPRVKVPRFAA